MIDGSETETIDDGPARWSPEEKKLDPFDPFDYVEEPEDAFSTSETSFEPIPTRDQQRGQVQALI